MTLIIKKIIHNDEEKPLWSPMYTVLQNDKHPNYRLRCPSIAEFYYQHLAKLPIMGLPTILPSVGIMWAQPRVGNRIRQCWDTGVGIIENIIDKYAA